MSSIRVLILSLGCLLCLQQECLAQIDFFLKGRASEFKGSFGNYYEGIGLEGGLTIHSETNITAGGIHGHYSWIGSLPPAAGVPELDVYMTSFNFHYGGRATLGKIFHPFAYGVVGIRTIDFEYPGSNSEDDAFFTSLTPTFGARAGLQVGGQRWRVEASVDYLSGSNAKYLTPETIQEAHASGRSYRELAKKSMVNNLSLGLGLVYVIQWQNWIQQVGE